MESERKDKIDVAFDKIKATLTTASALLVELKADITMLTSSLKAIEEIEQTLNKKNDSPDTE